MAASDVGSWLEANPQMDTGSCLHGLQICGAKALTWWRDTTDPVVLNSPWLRRGTGRFFRALFTFGQIGAWLCVLLPNPRMRSGYIDDNIPSLVVAAVCLALSSGTSLWTSRENFRGSMFFGIGSAISIRLLTAREIHFKNQFSYSFVIAVMCHCNVHPAVLLLVVFYHLLLILGDLYHGQAFVACMTMMTFECAMLVAFTWDFTLRVKAGIWQ
jgi:hypothetical protein